MDDAKTSTTDDQANLDNPATPIVAEKPSPLRRIHTNTFVQILDQSGSSLAVITYQAGKLVLLRAEMQNGSSVANTHFRDFRKPMGFAFESSTLFPLPLNSAIDSAKLTLHLPNQLRVRRGAGHDVGNLCPAVPL